jgi:hypothetical protein
MLEGSEIGKAGTDQAGQRRLGKSYPVGKGKSGNVSASVWPAREGKSANVSYQISERVAALPVSGYVNFNVHPDDLIMAKARAIKDAQNHGFVDNIA